MLYLVYTHNYLLELMVQSNLTESYLGYKDFSTVLILSGYYMVDVLFFISGAVGAFMFMKKLEK